LQCLERGAASVDTTDTSQESRLNLAKMYLMTARWMDSTDNYGPESVLAQYKDVVNKYAEWEKGHFFLAKYYEKLMNNLDERNETLKKLDFGRFVVKHYSTSLQYGSKYIYQSMPGMLTLWLDSGALAQREDSDVKPADKAYLHRGIKKLNEDFERYVNILPAYQFLTSFSQLISRICHPHPQVWKILEDMIANIMCVYKQQAIWALLAVSKSSFGTRRDRCRHIFEIAIRKKPELKIFIKDSMQLGEMLIDVANKKCGPKDTKLYMSKDFVQLRRLVTDPSFSEIIIPTQAALTVTLPVSASDRNFNPFPDNLPMIKGLDDVVEVLASLQRPKKIVIRGSDGNSYSMMAKPKDDLRKDGRLMEFNYLVNKLLLRDPGCRRRMLRIRTYAVIPLNEECGLIEWVLNTSGLRYIINKINKDNNMLVKVPELKKMYEPITGKHIAVEVKKEHFAKNILPQFPAVFHQWYLMTFPTPTKWYMARLAFSHSCAVMSMVGFTLGLGDRHGENILLDGTNGECLHVDFNCLFNKGETFDCPEVVPFRLTHNMVRAMGPLGVEGVFRQSCEQAMGLMRTQRDSLLSVLSTFLYDPLLEWKRETVAGKRFDGTGGSHGNGMAVTILKDIEKRLQGYNKSSTIHIPLSIEGQVHQLIKQATDLENLASMYIGWAAYM